MQSDGAASRIGAFRRDVQTPMGPRAELEPFRDFDVDTNRWSQDRPYAVPQLFRLSQRRHSRAFSHAGTPSFTASKPRGEPPGWTGRRPVVEGEGPPRTFDLDEAGAALAVAGSPPD